MLVSRVILTVEQTLQKILSAFDHRISIQDNWDCQEILVLDSGPADTEILIPHKLERVPTYYIANPSLGGVVYDSDRANWSKTLLKLKCSVPNAELRLIVL